MRLRLVAFGVQLLVLGAASLSGSLEPHAGQGLWALVLANGLVTVVLRQLWRRGRIRARISTVGGVLLADTALLTWMLLLSGGSSNPFSVFYIVHVALAARLLSTRWTAVLAVATTVAFASLFALTPEGAMHAMHRGSGMLWHLRGMWVSYTLTAAIVGYFMARTTRAIEARDADLLRATQKSADASKLAALGTLAAGAAHELGTPLGTIALVAEELAHAPLARTDLALAADLKLLQAEVVRCKSILRRMASAAGESYGESAVPVQATELATDIREAFWHTPLELIVHVAAHWRYALPRAALRQVLVSLVDNALAASEGSPQVSIYFEGQQSICQIRVVDSGAGMTPDVLARASEPFYSTKEPGSGMGLGLYLAHGFAAALGGTLHLESAPFRGTCVTLSIPSQEVP